MAGNRVEELETKVRELEATVSGLTDELVETKERLRQVEDQFGPDLDDIVEGKPSRRKARQDGGERRTQQRPPSAREQSPAAETERTPERADEQPAADEAKSDEAEGADDGSGSSDDIIVA